MKGKAESEEYMRYVVCQHMGWDYYTYESQPPHFLEEIYIFMTQESMRDSDEARKMESATSKAKPKTVGLNRNG